MKIFNAPISLRQLELLRCSYEKYELLVLPTDTVYGIGVKPDSSTAIERLLAAKGRGRQMPPPVVGADYETLREYVGKCDYPLEELCRQFWPGPLTLILPTPQDFPWNLGEITGSVALRVPNSEQMLEILRTTGPLALTSANITGAPPALTCEQAREYFGDSVGCYVDGGPAPLGKASTILDLSSEKPRILRAGSIGAKELAKCLGREVNE
ncbi:threonylcarbamoyl-AMP synthase [Actinomycetaceae bacterium TAE3-ERU4]|nr:threonylcarbamoyl-AMP synthase [Actinomycetaceae bacterium TAE3-ERU4]